MPPPEDNPADEVQSTKEATCPEETIAPGLVRHYKRAAHEIGDLFAWCILNLKKFPPITGDWLDEVKKRLALVSVYHAWKVSIEESGDKDGWATVHSLQEQLATLTEANAAMLKELQHIAVHHIGTTYPVPEGEAPLYIQNRGRMGEYEDDIRKLTAANAELVKEREAADASLNNLGVANVSQEGRLLTLPERFECLGMDIHHLKVALREAQADSQAAITPSLRKG